jgi:hypothetical protein
MKATFTTDTLRRIGRALGDINGDGRGSRCSIATITIDGVPVKGLNHMVGRGVQFNTEADLGVSCCQDAMALVADGKGEKCRHWHAFQILSGNKPVVTDEKDKALVKEEQAVVESGGYGNVFGPRAEVNRQHRLAAGKLAAERDGVAWVDFSTLPQAARRAQVQNRFASRNTPRIEI